MKALAQALAVGGAGFLGALARWGLGAALHRWFGSSFPVGTLVINVSGALALGWFLAAAGNKWDVSDTTRLAVAVGFLGAYTTFSTFVYESDALVRHGLPWRAAAYLVGSVALGLAAVRAGMWLGGAGGK